MATEDLNLDEATSLAAEVTAAEAAAAGEADTEPAAELSVPEGLVTIAEAIGMMWAAFQLYPDPLNTPAWERATELMRSSDVYPAFLDVSPDFFTLDGVEVPATVEGTARAARTMFVHEVASITLPAPPPEPDLIRLFEAMALEPDALLKSGGVKAVMTNAGISSIEIVSRAPLKESDETIEQGRHSDVREYVDGALDAETLAQRVAAGGDADVITERFTTLYEDVVGKVDPDDYMAHEAVVNLFAEAYFLLDSDARLAILEYCLAARTKPAFQVLLDQFSGHDLAAMAGDLSDEAASELSDYARVSIEEGRPEELLGMLQSAAEVEEARKAVAGRISELLDDDGPEVGRGATFARIRSEIAALPPASGMGRRVLRDLLALEHRDARYRRLLRIWTGKIARAIHDEDYDDAERWLDSALADPIYPEERQAEVDEALGAMATDDLIAALIGETDASVIHPFAMRLISHWGDRVTDRLVERLAEEEDPGGRRALIDVLAVISSSDATALLAHLSDKRWYLVRNLAIACGKTGRVEVAPRLRKLATTHNDHRVRVEALRALMPVSAGQGVTAAIRALRDDHKRVRQAALTALGAVEDDRADEAMAEALASKEVPTEVKLRVIEVLGERKTPGSRSALEAVAGRRSLVGSGKALRQAAQEALRS